MTTETYVLTIKKYANAYLAESQNNNAQILKEYQILINSIFWADQKNERLDEINKLIISSENQNKQYFIEFNDLMHKLDDSDLKIDSNQLLDWISSIELLTKKHREKNIKQHDELCHKIIKFSSHDLIKANKAKEIHKQWYIRYDLIYDHGFKKAINLSNNMRIHQKMWGISQIVHIFRPKIEKKVVINNKKMIIKLTASFNFKEFLVMSPNECGATIRIANSNVTLILPDTLNSIPNWITFFLNELDKKNIPDIDDHRKKIRDMKQKEIELLILQKFYNEVYQILNDNNFFQFENMTLQIDIENTLDFVAIYLPDKSSINHIVIKIRLDIYSLLNIILNQHFEKITDIIRHELTHANDKILQNTDIYKKTKRFLETEPHTQMVSVFYTLDKLRAEGLATISTQLISKKIFSYNHQIKKMIFLDNESKQKINDLIEIFNKIENDGAKLELSLNQKYSEHNSPIYFIGEHMYWVIYFSKIKDLNETKTFILNIPDFVKSHNSSDSNYVDELKKSIIINQNGIHIKPEEINRLISQVQNYSEQSNELVYYISKEISVKYLKLLSKYDIKKLFEEYETACNRLSIQPILTINFFKIINRRKIEQK